MTELTHAEIIAATKPLVLRAYPHARLAGSGDDFAIYDHDPDRAKPMMVGWGVDQVGAWCSALTSAGRRVTAKGKRR